MLKLTPAATQTAAEKLPEVQTGLFDNNTTVEQVIEWINAQTLSANPFVIAMVPLGEDNQHVEKTRTKTVKGENGAPDSQVTYTQKVYLGGNVESRKEGKAKISAVDLPAFYKDAQLQLVATVSVSLDEDAETAE
jgi:hypothetical protein